MENNSTSEEKQITIFREKNGVKEPLRTVVAKSFTEAIEKLKSLARDYKDFIREEKGKYFLWDYELTGV